VASGCGGRSNIGSWMAPSTASNHPAGQLLLGSSRTINSTRCPTSGASSGKSTVVDCSSLWIRMAVIVLKIPRRLEHGDQSSRRNTAGQRISPGPRHSPTTLAHAVDAAALATELLGAQQAGDRRWIGMAERLTSITKPGSILTAEYTLARRATELAEEVLNCAAEQAAKQTGKRQ